MSIEINGVWAENESGVDTYLAFRGSIALDRDQAIVLNVLSSGWHRVWLDGEMLTQGPARYNIDFPEYEPIELELTAGIHIISSLVHNTAVSTRMLEKMPPFWYCESEQADIEWKCLPFEAFESGVRRINPQLDWVEWCDTRKLPENWHQIEFDDSCWQSPISVAEPIGKASRLSSGRCLSIVKEIEPFKQGQLAEVFSYEKDDPPSRFFLRDLECSNLPPDGIWRRYDLGRVRLASPSFIIKAPEGAVVEFAFAEHLISGRVAPYINCSDGLSANMDHYIARGGLQEFAPITPKGGRFLELHIIANPDHIEIHKESVIERAYYEKADTEFYCDDELLNKIWYTGIETFRACTEDAVTDNPTRERGQWTGDVVSVGMEIARAGFRDMLLFKRALMQAAQSRKDNGLVAGMSPGASIYVSSFSAQWVGACVRYYEITGDVDILRDNYKYAVDNLKVFEDAMTDRGLSRSIDWAFIDWGYQIDGCQPDIAMDCHYLDALEKAIQWANIIDDNVAAVKYAQIAKKLRAIIQDNIIDALSGGWDAFGYHSSVLAGNLGFFTDEKLCECIGYVKSHILSCFPENVDGQRLSNPKLKTKNVMTPYFSHFAFDFLIQNNELDFVLERYRNCWGWALRQGLTTWPEVFDLRWSHCHQWSGCPTWQLSKYLLGLDHRLDKGRNCFEFVLKSCELKEVKGTLVLPDGGVVNVQWHKQDGKIRYCIKADQPITVTGLPGRSYDQIRELDISL